MSEAIREHQSQLTTDLKTQEHRKIDGSKRPNYPPSIDLRLKTVPVSKEVILRLIKFIEQI